MQWIVNAKPVLEYLKKKKPGTIDFVPTDLGCTRQADLALYMGVIKDLSKNKIISYSEENQTISFTTENLEKYERFDQIRGNLANLYNFLIQCLRDCYCVNYFRTVNLSSFFTTEVIVSCVYNFSAGISIGINKVLKDKDGKFNLEDIAAKTRRFCFDYQMNDQLTQLTEKKKDFSKYLKSVNQKIQTFNDYRDTFFAHSDKGSQKNVNSMDLSSAIDIIQKCLTYTIEIANTIDDQKDEESVNDISKLLIVESHYFTKQLSGK